MHTLSIIEVTAENTLEETPFCVKDITNYGFGHKRKWFRKRYTGRLHEKKLKNEDGKWVFDINLQIKRKKTQEAKYAPSGYGVINLMYNGWLVEDHCIGMTRFKNKLKKRFTDVNRLHHKLKYHVDKRIT